jgi:hypothetical protein
MAETNMSKVMNWRKMVATAKKPGKSNRGAVI